MKKFVLIPDSFKGTMSSMEICSIMRESISEIYSNAIIESIPVADGGEGSVDCFLQALGGEKIFLPVKNPFFQEMQAFYGFIDDGKTAVVEIAACAGLPLVEDHKDPCRTTTYGVGQLILNAVQRGVKKIIVGLGGSATNDGGCGAAAAVGVRFLNRDNEAFVPTGGTLCEIAHIDVSTMDQSLRNVEIVTMCDIDNPMYGPTGAAYIFAPQKGATDEMVEFLDAGLQNLDRVIRSDIGMNLSQLPGAGAAGAMGVGMMAFFNSKLQMGIETVLDTVQFDRIISNADMILTGEGKIDTQSLRGKVVIGVARRARLQQIPVVAVVGDIGNDVTAVYGEGVTGIFSINRIAVDFNTAKFRSKDDMKLTIDNLMRFCKGIGL